MTNDQKSQIPNNKFQTNYKLQITMFKTVLDLGFRSLGIVWNLEFGICYLFWFGIYYLKINEIDFLWWCSLGDRSKLFA